MGENWREVEGPAIKLIQFAYNLVSIKYMYTSMFESDGDLKLALAILR